MSFVIICAGLASGKPVGCEGRYLHGADVDAFDGRGWVDWTDEPSQALTFETGGQALQFWRRASTVRPRRPDGKPNRPLTAYSIAVASLKSVLPPADTSTERKP